MMCPKPHTLRSKAVTQSARGRECTLRIPHVCNHNPETVVFCHIRMPGFCGVSQKPPDFMGFYGCSSCHDAQEGRVPNKRPSGNEVLRAVMETQSILFAEGILTAKGQK